MKSSHFFRLVIFNVLTAAPCTIWCGKKIIVTVDGALNGSTINPYYKEKTIRLNNCGITDLSGIEKLTFKNKTLLNLANNNISDLDSLFSVPTNNALKKIILRDNNIEDVSKETLIKIKEHFPNLNFINLRGNSLKKSHKFERWKAKLGLSYTIKVREKND